MEALIVRRRTVVAHGALPIVQAGRQIELAGLPALARIAVLVEAAGSLAAMARRQADLAHIDSVQVALVVTDPADAMAVLGHGRWLPTMQRRVLASPRRLAVARAVKRQGKPSALVGQLDLFNSNNSPSQPGRR